MMSPAHDGPRAIRLALLAYAAFSTMDTAVKLLSARFHPVQIACLVATMSLLVPVLAACLRGEPRRLRTRAPGLQLLRGLLMLIGGVAAFAAYALMPLADAYAIAFTMPLLVTALAVPLLGERVGARRWAAIGVGFAGVLVVSGETGEVNIGEKISTTQSQISGLGGATGTNTAATSLLAGAAQTSFSYEDVGVKIKVEPRVHNNGEITLKIDSLVTTLKSGSTPGRPDLGKREIKTSARLRDGETAIFGGLLKDEEQKSLQGVWGLSDIPLLGRLIGNAVPVRLGEVVGQTIVAHASRFRPANARSPPASGKIRPACARRGRRSPCSPSASSR